MATHWEMDLVMLVDYFILKLTIQVDYAYCMLYSWVAGRDRNGVLRQISQAPRAGLNERVTCQLTGRTLFSFLELDFQGEHSSKW